MIFSSSQRPVFPLLPPYGEQDPKDGQVAPSHADGLTPYLGLRSRLSQLWLNRWTMLLLLILIRILIAVTSINTSMGSAKSEALSACTALESMGSSMASMPYYLAEGINELTAKTVQGQVNTIRSRIMSIIYKYVSNQAISEGIDLLFPIYREGLKIPATVVDQLIAGAQSDIRQVLNMLSTWKLSSNTMTYDESKDM